MGWDSGFGIWDTGYGMRERLRHERRATPPNPKSRIPTLTLGMHYNTARESRDVAERL